LLGCSHASPSARPSRLGAALHIAQRGHNRSACFFDDQDRHAYLGWLDEALRRERCRLHAYVLMTNHVHLLLTPADARSVPRVLIAVGRRYVQRINRTYGRTGTLWDSRYKSSLVQAETYLLLCQRYIELNPVRAAMVADPADYPWSSYRANALGERNPILSPHRLYLAFAGDTGERPKPIAPCFALRWTTSRSRICAWHSTRISPSATTASTPRSMPSPVAVANRASGVAQRRHPLRTPRQTLSSRSFRFKHRAWTLFRSCVGGATGTGSRSALTARRHRPAAVGRSRPPRRLHRKFPNLYGNSIG
jgi:REP element-mobilizing transposase RayT